VTSHPSHPPPRSVPAFSYYVRWQHGTIPAFARRTPCCCAPCSNRSIFSAGRAHSSKVCCCDPCWDRQADGWTYGQTSHRFINPAPHILRAMSSICIPQRRQSKYIFRGRSRRRRRREGCLRIFFDFGSQNGDLWCILGAIFCSSAKTLRGRKDTLA